MEEKKKSKLKIILIIAAVVVVLLVIMIALGSGGSDDTQAESDYEETLEDEDTGDYEEEDEGTKVTSSSDDKWTVMVYMCGTDLESGGAFATMNLAEMMEAELSDNVNVLVEAGGCNYWYINEYADDLEDFTEVDTDLLNFYHIVGENMVLEKTESLRSMGDPGNLTDFLTWGSQSYPADKYMLIFWDHGGGSVGGVCSDELHDHDNLSLTEIKEAIAGADLPIELVGFDACLMASLETAEALQGYGHYMVASEETEPGGGWAYSDFLSYLSKDTGMSGLELGKRIADSYMDKCEQDETDALATLSVTDLTRIPTLSAAYKGLSGEILLATQDVSSFTEFTQGAIRAENYGGNNDSEGYSDMVDIGDLVAQTQGVLEQNSGSVIQALKDAVQYEVHGSNRANSNGLSVFYPLYVDEDIYGEYTRVSDNTAFAEYVSILCGDWDESAWQQAWEEAYSSSQTEEGKYDDYFNNGESVTTDTGFVPDEDYYESVSSMAPVSGEDYNIEFTQHVTDEGFLQLSVTNGLDAIQDVSFQLFYMDEETETFLYLGSDNNINADFEKGVFEDNFYGEWMTIGGEYVYAELIEQNEDYNLYTIPIKLNGEEMFLKAVYDYNKEEYRILGAYDGMDDETGQSGRDVKKLKAGDKITFLFGVFDLESESDDVDFVELGEITWSDDMKMIDEEMGDGSFFYMFCMTDVFGNEITGDPVYIEIKDGEIYESEL
ncbi:MAG: hypothetical protein K6E63_02230 [Lachnospiraceae bacterium]|nr:hypothetical protein [Lachnospiraceae bacterium]